MIDRLFTAALTFCLLIGATFAIGSAWTDSRSTRLVTQLPPVEVVAKRPLPRIDMAANEAAAPRLQ